VPTAATTPHDKANVRADRSLHKRYSQFGTLLSIWVWSERKLVTKY